MIQLLRCSDCGDLSAQGTGHECWVRAKLAEGKVARVWTDCLRCGQPQVGGIAHWRCWREEA